jgi:hypothetical protein
MKLYPSRKNVGGWDRMARLVLGPVLLVVAGAELLGAIAIGTVAFAVSLVVGSILTVTGLTQKCPASQAAGVNTYDERGDGEDVTETDREMEGKSRGPAV